MARAEVGTRRQWREALATMRRSDRAGRARAPGERGAAAETARGGARRGRSGRALRLIFSHDRPVAPAREGEK